MCDCDCHEEEIWDYRLMLGNRYEGLSIREVVYNKQGDIIGWNPRPIGMPMSSIADVRKQLVAEMKELDDMLEATKKPMLDEAKLERGIK